MIEKFYDLLKRLNPDTQLEFEVLAEDKEYTIYVDGPISKLLLPGGFQISGGKLTSLSFKIPFRVNVIQKKLNLEEKKSIVPEKQKSNEELDVDTRYQIINRRRAASEEECVAIKQMVYTAAWILLAGFSIYMNKDGIAPMLEAPESLLAWPQFIEFIKEIGPLTAFSVFEAALHTKSYFKHSRVFRKNANELLSISQAHINCEPSIVRRLLDGDLSAAIDDAFEEIKRRF